MVPILYVRQIAQTVEELGADVDAWLGIAQLDRQSITDCSISFEVGLFRRLLGAAVAMTGESGLGLLVGARLAPAEHGIVGHATMASRSVREAIELFARFMPLRTPLLTMQVADVPDGVRFWFEEIPALAEVPHVVADIALLSLYNIIAQLLDGNVAGLRAYVAPADPGHTRIANKVLGCYVIAGSGWTGIEIPASIADAELPHNDAIALSEALAICETQLAQRCSRTILSVKVRILLSNAGEVMPTLNDVAAELGMSPRTLHRRLVDEETSYRDILEIVRQISARELLFGHRLTVKEVSYRLGYTDVANFRRAYKRWTGVPPAFDRNAIAKGKPRGN